MAALRKKQRSPFWFACFTLPGGKRTQRSTKETARKAAQAKADEWERLAKTRANARQAQKVISDIYAAAHKEELPDSTTRLYFEGWLERRKREVAPSSLVAYKGRANHFIEWLGDAAERPIAEIETRHIMAYRDALGASLSPSTANQGVKILRVIYEDARRENHIAENPAKACGLLKKDTSKPDRRPFTLDELRSVLAVADAEWRSMIFFGLYTGQRLADIARLTWANVDITAGEIQLRSGKTNRVVRIPVCTPLMRHLTTLPSSSVPHAPLHPRLAALGEVNSSTLSRQFGELVAAVGLNDSRPTRGKDARSKGHSTRRKLSTLSFHSLRHTATSLMKNAGVSPAIVMDIIGHDSAEMSTHYTHIESAAKRKALDTMPDLTR